MDKRPSRTALMASLMRALHSRSDPSPILDDPWGDRLVAQSERETMNQRHLARLDPDERARASAAPTALLDEVLRTSAGYPGVIIRSRYAEDRLREATIAGVRQYVLIGAGFDSFALRRPDFAAGLDIFEIDHPATQSFKLERIRECGISLPPSVHFIAADLANEGLEAALARSAFRKDEAAFFSWLGVTSYLTREANLQTLRAVAKCGYLGSELVFTYVDQIEFAPGGLRSPDHPYAQAVAKVGEPYVSGFDPKEIAHDLKRVGLELVEDLDGTAMAERYARSGGNILRPSAGQHIVCARVATGHDFE